VDSTHAALTSTQAEVTSVRAQLDALQREHEEATKQLAVRTTEVTHFKSQVEVYQESTKAHEAERNSLSERWLQTAGENTELRRQVDEYRQTAQEKTDEVRLKEEEVRRLDDQLAAAREDASKLQTTRLEASFASESHAKELTLIKSQAEHERIAEAREMAAKYSRMESERALATHQLEDASRKLAHSTEEAETLRREMEAIKRQAEGDVASLHAECDRRVRSAEAEAVANREGLRVARAEVDKLQAALAVKPPYDKAKVERLRDKYELKLAKLHRQIVEREQHEMRLRGLLESELRGLSHWNADMDRKEAAAPRADAGQWNSFFSHKFGEVTDHLDRRIDQILRK
jgi:chromosome segregation ATPase